MKKILKYALYSLLIVFFLNLNVKADYASESDAKEALKDEKGETATYYCKYNSTGENNGQYDVIVAISADKKKAYADTKDSGEEPILNWKENDEDWDDSADEIGFSAYEYYLDDGCPPVVYKHAISVNTEYLGNTTYADYYYMITSKYYKKLKQSFVFEEELDEIYMAVIENTDFGEIKNCKYSTSLYSNNYKSEFVNKEFTLKISKNGRILNESEFKSQISLSNEARMGYENSSICPNIFVCHIENGYHVGGAEGYDHMIYYGDYASDNRNSSTCLKFSCTNTEDGYCQPDAPDANVCNLYTTFYDDIVNHLNDYKSCGDDINCKNSMLAEYNVTKDLASSWCNQVFKSLRYTDSCLQRCLDLPSQIQTKEKDVGLNSISGITCNFSNNLIIWIANIVRWAKYLIPVIVIVLGILDFIKAIAADKDDEMKKAQGRFVKRLIAAALIFIIPFIIEFVLGKLGFDSNGCGIIDL